MAYNTEVWQVEDLVVDGRPAYDWGLPIEWYTPVFKLANLNGQVVWFYPKGSIFGEPRALTELAADILKEVNEAGPSFFLMSNAKYGAPPQ